jgi:hypothetical protein
MPLIYTDCSFCFNSCSFVNSDLSYYLLGHVFSLSSQSKRFRILKIKLLFRLLINTFGSGFVLNQFTNMLGIYISEERNDVCRRNFLRSLVSKCSKHKVYTDGGTCYLKPFLHLKHRLHSHLEKSLVERVIQYFKDRTEFFDDYYSYSD